MPSPITSERKLERKRTTAGILIGTALAVTAAAPAFALADSSPDAGAPPMPTGLLASSTPKTVVVDPATGDMLSLTLGEPSVVIAPAISRHDSCDPGNACYYTPDPNSTYHDQGFDGSAGTSHGTWPRRNAWDSGSYTAYACWKSACSSSWVGPNTYVSFGGSLVTGTSFGIR